ncbi:hypothetical protein EJ04DRAFT_562917 [Polyplosphaeria fusca]|uniref:Tymo-45kd-70kd multi-domain protein n=1 Tax=Polyplosphaeria fusca TaxID=682080 RepID=A0A9P4R370_9PLEO|nr:hypothetical protein EJ04DRAFT_562917 [Polyplosphaeria fusca]
MLLQKDPSLAEVPDFSPQQLETLTRSVEQKKQKLEGDIREYIRHKQDDLHQYERKLLEQFRSTDRAESSHTSAETVSTSAQAPAANHVSSNSPSSSSPPAEPITNEKELGPRESAKRTKHTRVHKREKELCGLVTPIFLPLLDAGDGSPTKKKKEKKRHREEKRERAESSPPLEEQGSPPRTVEKGKESRRSRSKGHGNTMEGEEVAAVNTEQKQPERKEEKKSKRSAVKKSSLRNLGTPRPRRKRVSLVIDDQIVLPADNVAASSLVSPSETTNSSASNSTASLEDIIDPRLMQRVDTPMHHDAVHHSIPLPLPLPSTTPDQHTGHTLSESPPPLASETQSAKQSPPRQEITPAQLDLGQVQMEGPSILQPSPTTDPLLLPQYASATPIYASTLELAEEPEEEFSTYVGGIDGSGHDNVNQQGSYGYPSSLGASYLESYMKSRPLSVRMAAAEKAELAEQEKKALIAGEKPRDEEMHVDMEMGRVDDGDEGMDVMGGMEGL